MANSSYQIPTTPKLYISYPLFQYSNGHDITGYYGGGYSPGSDTELVSTTQIQHRRGTIYNDQDQEDYVLFPFRIGKKSWNIIENGIWDFDYLMILDHTFAEDNVYPTLEVRDESDTYYHEELELQNIINYNVNGPPEYNGWSLIKIAGMPSTSELNLLDIKILHEAGTAPEFEMGSILFGKEYTFPQNCKLNTSLNVSYGIKTMKTITGKTLTKANWTKTQRGVTEPFGLYGEPSQGSISGQELDQFEKNFIRGRRSGIRTWTMEFDSLGPDKVMNQNPMLNNNNWTASDNHTLNADGSSLYNIHSSPDFYTSVVHKLMGSHLKCVLALDKDSTNPDNFVVVRMNKDYKITQKSPNLYNIKVSFEEQI